MVCAKARRASKDLGRPLRLMRGSPFLNGFKLAAAFGLFAIIDP